MIRSAYLAPAESPSRSIDVKRALLTYDRVYLADPGDRDLIPPQAFTSALGFPSFFSFDGGPIRPIGKTANYDNEFDQLMDEIQVACRDGCAEVISSFERSSSELATIGGIQMGNYPLSPTFMLHAYRNIARESDVLVAAINGDQQLMAMSDGQIDDLGLEQARGDGGINDDPALPPLECFLSREHLRGKFSAIARARMASTIKSIGYCASKDIVPIFANPNFEMLARIYANRAEKVIDIVAQEDVYWINRRRALGIMHEEYLDDDVLAAMSVAEVLTLRSRIWGEQAEARDGLLAATAELAREALKEEDFEVAIRDRIQSYRSVAHEVQKQRSALSFKINCEFFKGAGGAVAAVMAGSTTTGVLTQMQTAMGAGTALLAGCLWSIGKIQDFKPAAEMLRSAESEFKDNVCFGIHNFYQKIGKAVGSNNV